MHEKGEKIAFCRWTAFASSCFPVLIISGMGIILACRGYAQSPTQVAPGIEYSVVARGLHKPRGLFFAPSGSLYVVEQVRGNVLKIGEDGHLTEVAKGLSDPHDLTMDTHGNLYIAETGAKRVARISPRGTVTTYISGLRGPVDLDFNPRGELFVCELGAGRVTAFKSAKEARVFVNLTAHGLAFDKSGVTFVNDWGRDRIVKVDVDGQVKPIAKVEVPIGLAIGKSGDLYVAQRQAGKVLRVKLDGTRIILIEGLKAPRDPAFDAAGNLYVAETGAGRILRLEGDF